MLLVQAATFVALDISLMKRVVRLKRIGRADLGGMA
jgi:hypothetical protein